jgi:ubiquinone/menaquinone biosynthesis C-methylase UbiE
VSDTTTDENLKTDVKSYWNAHPCGTQFTDLPWGTREFFDAVEQFRYEIQPFMQKIIGFDRFAGRELLEIGCGLGTDLLQFARGGARVTGIDLSNASIDLVKKRFSLYGLPIRAESADAENLPFPDDSFDVVYSFGVLHHTPNTQKAIDEIYRILRPGGEIVIMLYHTTSLHVLAGVPLYWIYRLFSRSQEPAHSALEEWIRIYDGTANPLGRSYTRSQARQLFSRFLDVRFHTCDPLRRRFPRSVNWINQKLFASWLGFYLVITAKK